MTEEKITLEQMLRNSIGPRYKTVTVALDWIKVLQQGDDVKGLSQAELITRALSDVLSGAVSEKEVNAGMAKYKASPQYAAAAAERADERKGE